MTISADISILVPNFRGIRTYYSFISNYNYIYLLYFYNHIYIYNYSINGYKINYIYLSEDLNRDSLHCVGLAPLTRPNPL